MGFLTAQDAGWKGQGNSLGATVSVTAMKAGDILLFALCTTVAADGLTVGGLTNAATYIDANINIGGLFSGNGTGTIGYVVIAAADVSAHTFTIASSKSSTIGYAWVLIRPTAISGGACTVQANGPGRSPSRRHLSPARKTRRSTHTTAASSLSSIPGIPTAGLYTIAETKTSDNPAAAQTYNVVAGEGGTGSNDVTILVNTGHTPSALDTGSATLTESGGSAAPKWYVRPFVVSEGASDGAPAVAWCPDPDTCPVPILATGLDHELGSAAAASAPGSGSGISVY
jgi:hypothetical protein